MTDHDKRATEIVEDIFGTRKHLTREYARIVIAMALRSAADAQAARIAELEAERDVARQAANHNAGLFGEAELARRAAEAERDRLRGVVEDALELRGYVTESVTGPRTPATESAAAEADAIEASIRAALSPAPQECKTCGGKGRVVGDYLDRTVPCPDCHGGDHG
jgi:hypothetical protein